MPPYASFHNFHGLYKIILQLAARRASIAFASVLFLAITFFFLRPLAHADGFAFPPAAVKKIPEIPMQRAVLTWRDGQERMVIESTFKSEAERLGWIVPVPAKPTRFEAITPGFAGQLEFITRPRVIHSSASQIFNDHYLLVIVAALLACGCLGAGIRQWHWGVLLLAGLGVTTLLLVSPKLGKNDGVKSASAATLTVESQSRVGNYQIEVLNAQAPQAVSDWLTAHGFAPLPAESESIIKRLIDEKWRFVAATLHRSGRGLIQPHPLAITFPSHDLIYPMRLTALSPSPVYLELFTIAVQQASNPLLQTEYCNQFDELPMHVYEAVNKDNPLPQMSIVDHGEKFGMWPGCTLTRMTGTFTPDQMRSDLAFTWKEPAPFRSHFYSRAGAASLALSWALLAWCCGAGCLLIDRAFNTWSTLKTAVAPGTDLPAFRRATFGIAAGALLVGFIVYPCLPNGAVQATISRPKQNAALLAYLKMADIIEGSLSEKPDEKLDALRQKIDHNLEAQNLRQAMPVVAGQAAMINRKKDYELIENADGSVDYVITMPDGELWGSRLRKSEREQAEEEMSKMLDKMNAPQ